MALLQTLTRNLSETQFPHLEILLTQENGHNNGAPLHRAVRAIQRGIHFVDLKSQSTCGLKCFFPLAPRVEISQPPKERLEPSRMPGMFVCSLTNRPDLSNLKRSGQWIWISIQLDETQSIFITYYFKTSAGGKREGEITNTLLAMPGWPPGIPQRVKSNFSLERNVCSNQISFGKGPGQPRQKNLVTDDM